MLKWSVDLLKRCISILLVLALAISMIAPFAWSRTEFRYELCANGVTFGNDYIIAAPQQLIFHQQNAKAADLESASIAFPGTLPLSQDCGTNVALPSIAQHTDQSASVTDTGYYEANYCYCPGPNEGNVPITSTYIQDLSTIKPGRLIGSAPMRPEMVNTVPGERKLSQLAQQANNTSGQGTNKSLPDQLKRQILLNSPVNLTSDSINTIRFSAQECPTCVGPSIQPPTVGAGTGGTGQAGTGSAGTGTTGQAGTSVPKNESANTTPATPATKRGYDLTYEHFNLSADKATIENMSITDRMWRNAHIGGMMWTAYQGDTAAPGWVSPFDKPQTIVQMSDHFQVIKDSLNMTKAGTNIKPSFWRL